MSEPNDPRITSFLSRMAEEHPSPPRLDAPETTLRRARARIATTLTVSTLGVILVSSGVVAGASALRDNGGGPAHPPVRVGPTARVATPSSQPSIADANCSNRWALADDPSVQPAGSALFATSALTPSDVWAVGSNQHARHTLVERWNGAGWTIVPSPDGAGSQNELFAVVAVSPDDAWAAGYSGDGHESRTLIEHWDGTSWSIVASPDGGSGENQITGLAATSPNSIWAVGGWGDLRHGQGRPLVSRWSGAKWNPVQTDGAQGTNLWDVSASAPDSAMAVGGNGFAEVWDGTSWRPLPSAGPDAVFRSVTALAPGSYWVVGDRAYEWSGSWHATDLGLPQYGLMFGSTAVSQRDLWAVGFLAGGPTDSQTFIAGGKGSGWPLTQAPNSPGHDLYALAGATSLTDGHVWAVGWVESVGRRALVEERVCAQ